MFGWRLAVALELDREYPDQLPLPKYGGRYLLSDHNCHSQAGHSDFEPTMQSNLGFSLLLSVLEATSSCLCPGGYKFVHYSENDKKGLAGVLVIPEFQISANSVNVGRGHV